MKKQIFIKVFLIAIASVLVSCSDDDDNTIAAAAETPVLIKKITETVYYSDNSETRDMDFIYENNRLITVTTKSSAYPELYKTNFTYNGDKVFQAINYTNDAERSKETYVYDNDFLMQIVSNRVDQPKTEFKYTNGILSSAESGYMLETYVVTNSSEFTFSSGNLIQQQVFSANFGSPETTKETYTFDSKNNPVKFMNKYLRYIFSTEGFNGMSQNNMISRLSYYPTVTSTPKQFTYQLVYNANDFPTEIKQFSPEGTVISLTKIEYQ